MKHQTFYNRTTTGKYLREYKIPHRVVEYTAEWMLCH